jgi:hypothetical protein
LKRGPFALFLSHEFRAKGRAMTFEGNPLWLIGIAAAVIYGVWVLIRACLHVENQDAINGRRDLDDDGHLPFH